MAKRPIGQYEKISEYEKDEEDVYVTLKGLCCFSKQIKQRKRAKRER